MIPMIKNEHAFTLIELLVTVGIIGILASIAIPSFVEYRDRAYDSAAISDLRNFILAQEVYVNDNNDYLTCRDATCTSGLDSYGFSGPSSRTTIGATGATNIFTGETTWFMESFVGEGAGLTTISSQCSSGSGRRFTFTPNTSVITASNTAMSSCS